jgi:hypothetical protein
MRRKMLLKPAKDSMNSPALHIFRGVLRKEVEDSRPMHNTFSEGGPSSAMEIARSLGDLSHNVRAGIGYRVLGSDKELWFARTGSHRLTQR